MAFQTDRDKTAYLPASQFRSFLTLTHRHLLVFTKNWILMLFTLMVPLAIFAVYALFLRPLETSAISNQLDQVLTGADLSSMQRDFLYRSVAGIADEWMIAGVLSVSCVTVSFNTNTLMVRDRETGVTKDFLSSPLSQVTIQFSYFAFNIVVTFVSNLLVLAVSLIYLAGYNALLPSFVDFLAILGVLLLSTICASLVTFFICSFIPSESTMAPVTAILSAAIGFLNGAYLPASMLPSAMQTVTAFFPGAYSAGLFRNYFMTKPVTEMVNIMVNGGTGLDYQFQKIDIPAGLMTQSQANEMVSSFSYRMTFFDQELSPWVMALVILAFIGIFLALNLLFAHRSQARLTGFKGAGKKREKAEGGKR